MDLGKRIGMGVGEVEGGETMIGMHYMKEKPIFNEKSK